MSPARLARLWMSKRRLSRHRPVEPMSFALGSGRTPPPDWYGLDLFCRGGRVELCDLRLPLPIPAGTVSAVLAEHVLEHLALDDLPRLLRQVAKILRPNAPLRVVCPDAENVARLLLLGPVGEDDPDVQQDAATNRWPDDGFRWARSVNRLSHQWGEHRSLLTARMVQRLLEDANFHCREKLPSTKTTHFSALPDIHPERFPHESALVNFAVEGLAPGVGSRCSRCGWVRSPSERQCGKAGADEPR